MCSPSARPRTRTSSCSLCLSKTSSRQNSGAKPQPTPSMLKSSGEPPLRAISLTSPARSATRFRISVCRNPNYPDHATPKESLMQTDFLQFIYQAINNLLTQNLGFFDAMGQNMFRMFATILVVWYGVKSALSSASGRHFLHFDNFAALLLTISFGFGMVNYYSTPIPGIGTSFHNLITDESQFLAA